MAERNRKKSLREALEAGKVIDDARTADAPSLWESLGWTGSGEGKVEKEEKVESRDKPKPETRETFVQKPGTPTGVGPISDPSMYGAVLKGMQERGESPPSGAGGMKSTSTRRGDGIDLSGVNTAIEEIKKRERAGEKPEEYQRDLDNLRANIEKAKREYEERGRTTDWAEVAETIGRGLVKLGTAQMGMQKGVDVSGFNWGQPTDWEKIRERQGRDYTREIGVAEKAVEDVQRRRQMDAAERERQYQADLDKWKAALQGEEYKLGQQVELAKAREMVDRQEKGATQRQDALLARQREEDRQRQLVELEKEEKELSAVNQNLQAMVTGNTQQRKEAAERLSMLKPATLADTPPQAILDKATAKGDYTTWPSRDEQKASINNTMMTKIGQIRDRINYLKSLAPGARTSTVPAPAPAGQSEKIRVRLRKTGQTGTIPAGEFDPSMYERI